MSKASERQGKAMEAIEKNWPGSRKQWDEYRTSTKERHAEIDRNTRGGKR